MGPHIAHTTYPHAKLYDDPEKTSETKVCGLVIDLNGLYVPLFCPIRSLAQKEGNKKQYINYIDVSLIKTNFVG